MTAEELVNMINTLQANVMEVLDRIRRLQDEFARYEPLLIEAQRRLQGPLTFGRRKSG